MAASDLFDTTQPTMPPAAPEPVKPVTRRQTTRKPPTPSSGGGSYADSDAAAEDLNAEELAHTTNISKGKLAFELHPSNFFRLKRA